MEFIRPAACRIFALSLRRSRRIGRRGIALHRGGSALNGAYGDVYGGGLCSISSWRGKCEAHYRNGEYTAAYHSAADVNFASVSDCKHGKDQRRGKSRY